MKTIGWILIAIGVVCCSGESRGGLVLIVVGIGFLVKHYVNGVDKAYYGGEIYDFSFDKRNYQPPPKAKIGGKAALEFYANIDQVTEVLDWLRARNAITKAKAEAALVQLAQLPLNDSCEIELGHVQGQDLGIGAWQENIDLYSTVWTGIDAFADDLEELFDDMHARDE